jgi:alkylation response protein AidB-like acyl-CoA dehydrogenase
MTTLDTATDVEPVEEFRQRARSFLRENVPPAGDFSMARMAAFSRGDEEQELADVRRNRDLQRLFFDGGFAGICFPTEYEGQGLTMAHQMAFNEELNGYSHPWRIQIPTFQPCASIILDFGTEEQKREHLPKIFKGEALWMQLLSEPSGGSDVAGAQTSAVRDGDEWIINGSKIWTTGAWWSDWGLALVRTNWDVPKHRGLSVFVFELHQPGIEVHQIEMLNGAKEFCQEFITDLRVPDTQRIGAVDDGWTVGIRWMFYERSAMGGQSPYITQPTSMRRRSAAIGDPTLALARAAGKVDDPHTRQLVGEAHALGRVTQALGTRIGGLMATGQISDQAAAIPRLMGGMAAVRQSTISYEIAGSSAGVWDPDDDTDAMRGMIGMSFLGRQAAEIAGGTTEMARNVVSERVLGMPRERTLDKDVPFKDVPKGPPAQR